MEERMIADCPAPASAALPVRPPAKRSLLGLNRPALSQALGELGVPEGALRMRSKQLWQWIYVRGARCFGDMTSVSQELRTQLEATFTLRRPEVVAEQISVDGTR